MAPSKKLVDIDTFTPGLVTGITDKLNVGFSRFENILIDYMGRPKKRPGWGVDNITINSIPLYISDYSSKYNGLYDYSGSTTSPMLPYWADVSEDNVSIDDPTSPVTTLYFIPRNYLDKPMLTSVWKETDGATPYIRNVTAQEGTADGFPYSMPSGVTRINYTHDSNQTYLMSDGYPVKRVVKGRARTLKVGLPGDQYEKSTAAFQPLAAQGYLKTGYYGKNLLEHGHCDFKTPSTRVAIECSRESAWYVYLVCPIYASGRIGVAEVYDPAKKRIITMGRRVKVETANDTAKRELYPFYLPAATPHLWDENIIGYRVYRSGKGDVTITEQISSYEDGKIEALFNLAYLVTLGNAKRGDKTVTTKGDLIYSATENNRVGDIRLTDNTLWLPIEEAQKCRFVRDFYKDKDFKYDAVYGGFTVWDTDKESAWLDTVTDVELGSTYDIKGAINLSYLTDYVQTDATVPSGFTRSYSQFSTNYAGASRGPYSQDGLDRIYGYTTTGTDNTRLYPTCAIIQNGIMVMNDKKRPNLVFVSAPDGTDGFYADRVYSILGATEANPVTNILCVGSSILVFTKTSITIFRSTADVNVPFVTQQISTSMGCDDQYGAVALDGNGYFMYGKRLYQINVNGMIKPAGASFDVELEEATGVITMKASPKEGELYIMYPAGTNDDTITVAGTNLTDTINKTIIFNVRRNYVTTDNVRRDKFTSDHTAEYTPGGWTGLELDLLQDQDDASSLNYWYLPGLAVEYSISKYGEFRTRDTDISYNDVSQTYTKQIFPWIAQYTQSTPPVDTYPVRAVIERPLVFNSHVRLTSIIVYGSGSIKISVNPNGRGYITDRRITINEDLGTEIPFNFEGSAFDIRITHDTAEDLELDAIQVKITGKGKINLFNATEAGTHG